MSSVRDHLDDAFLSATTRRGTKDCSIKGLWPDLSTAASVLRIAFSLGELDGSECDEDKTLDDFFYLLQEVEEDARASTRHMNNNDEEDSPACFVVAVEGLDGSGKSTLVRKLTEGLQSSTHQSPDHVYSCATPSKSLSPFRPVFDRRGGPIARAFYMCSNYILQYEIRKAARAINNKGGSSGVTSTQDIPVFVVDRFFSSTCAYTIGWKNTAGTPAESIDNLPDSLFKWPPDLKPPDLMLILDVSDNVRRERVTSRAEVSPLVSPGGGRGSPKEDDGPPPASRHNPWDDRLSNDEELGQRIVAAHRRTIGPQCVETIDANGPSNEVAEAALKVVRDELTKKKVSLNNENKVLNSDAASRPITLAITGTHCSGKRTLGMRLAEILGWRFDPELGDILRPDTLVADCHKIGDGRSGGREDWDDFVHREECKRDEESGSETCNRVVETWHIGNLAWALQRMPSASNESVLKARAQSALREEVRRRSILFVHLQISPDTPVRRRKNEPGNAARLPMVDELAECTGLHDALDTQGLKLLSHSAQKIGLPLLVLKNDADGKEAIDSILTEIVAFVNPNQVRPGDTA